MTEQPRGCSEERCKSAGTYVSESGARRYYAEGELFGTCPLSGRSTSWVKTT